MPSTILSSLGGSISSTTHNGGSVSTTTDTELMSDSGGVAPAITPVLHVGVSAGAGAVGRARATTSSSTGGSPHAPGRAAQLQVRPYVGRTRLQRTAIKVHGVEPSQVPAGWEVRVHAALQQQGLKLESAYLRAGCCELVVDTVLWQADDGGSDGDGDGDDPMSNSAASNALSGILLGEAADGGSSAAAPAPGVAADASGFADSGDAAEGSFPMLLPRSRSSWGSRGFGRGPAEASDARTSCDDGSSGSSGANVDIGALIRALQLPCEGDMEYALTYDIPDGPAAAVESFDFPMSPDIAAAARGAGADAAAATAAQPAGAVGGKDVSGSGDGSGLALAASGLARSAGAGASASGSGAAAPAAATRGGNNSSSSSLDWCAILAVRPRVLCRQGLPCAAAAACPDVSVAQPPLARLSVDLCLLSQSEGDLPDQRAGGAAAVALQRGSALAAGPPELPAPPEVLVRSQGRCLPLAVSLRACGGAPGAGGAAAAVGGVDVDGGDTARPQAVPAPQARPQLQRCVLTAEVGLQALPELPGLLLLEVRMPHQARGSVVPVLLVDDPRVAAEVGELADSWQGAAEELRDVLLDLGCFTHHVHRAAGCLLAAALDDSSAPPGPPAAAPVPGSGAAEAAEAATTTAGFGGGGNNNDNTALYSFTATALGGDTALAAGAGAVMGGLGAGADACSVSPPAALSPQLRTRLLDLGTHLLSWFDDAGCWPHTAVWLEVALALMEALPTQPPPDDPASAPQQQLQLQPLAALLHDQPLPPSAFPAPAVPVPVSVLAGTAIAPGGPGQAAVQAAAPAAASAEPGVAEAAAAAAAEAAEAAALAAAAAAADAEDYDAWRTAFSTRLMRQLHLLVLCLYIAITARSWARRGDLQLQQPADASAVADAAACVAAGASAAAVGDGGAGGGAAAAGGEEAVWSWLQLLRDLAPSLVAVAPVLAPAAAWPVLRRRHDGGGAPWRALVRRCMAARHVAHLAAGVAVGWLAAAPRLPAVNDYHLGPAVFLGDGVLYLGTALVPVPAAALLALLRVPVYVRMWAAMGATFAPAYAWARAALVSGLALVTNAALHVFMTELYRRHRLRRQQDKRHGGGRRGSSGGEGSSSGGGGGGGGASGGDGSAHVAPSGFLAIGGGAGPASDSPM
ncbi:hypothetical protein HYH02_001578 [Chlamydomonas schloesseri]|uniref:Uncharacterized protein n=1 Tax=Chlamydomonas schloesseri TaxID=2026947 RepID=A0A836BC08_9CHLO|nr:hypothetical protein HYH02_001578 [Chlamydomonas schloesseri]|eukprot:KAG2453354.1 hypothetical protein HYH02_001578 [Chlamydomonas schloesseri]